MKKQYSGTGEGLRHVALQFMALTLEECDYDDLRSIYEYFNLRVTPIESNAKAWYANGWVKGELPKRYGSLHGLRVTPEYWSDIMRTITAEQAAQLSALPFTWREEDSGLTDAFARAFIDFVNGKPFGAKLNGLKWDVTDPSRRELTSIIRHLTHRPENAGFLKYLNPEVLWEIYHMEYADSWLDLKPAGDARTLLPVFWENELLPASVRNYMRDSYLYNVEFPRTGKACEILRAMASDGQYRPKLQAIQELHNGHPEEALSLLTPLLQADGALFFPESLTNFAYALALGLCLANPSGEKAAKGVRKTAETLVRSRKAAAAAECQAMLVALGHYVTGKAKEVCLQIPQKVTYNRMSRILAALFLRHYRILDQEPRYVKESLDFVVTGGYDYLRFLYSFSFDKLQSLNARLQEQTGLHTSLLPAVKQVEPWERTLDDLLRLYRPAVTRAASEKTPSREVERVAYVVDMDTYDVQPKLQKSKDGGLSWTKGRNIAMRSFQNSRAGYMTDQDRRVARMVKCEVYGWYGEEHFELSGRGVIAALAGCQCVFDAATDQRIEIIERPLTLRAEQWGDGFSVRSNAILKNLDSSGICLSREGNRQVTVVRVNAKQKETLEMLGKISVFPAESQGKLTRLLQNLSGSFTIMSPLLKDATDMKRVEASSLIAVQIAPVSPDTRISSADNAPAEQLFSIALAVNPFGNAEGAAHAPYQQPAQGLAIVSTTINGESVQTERDLKAEKRNLDALRRIMMPFGSNETGTNRWTLNTAQCLEMLDALRTATDICFIEWPQGVRMRVVRQPITADRLTLKIRSAGQWFELEGDVTIGDKEKMAVAQLLARLRTASGNFIRLSDDEYVALTEDLRRQLQSLDKMLGGRGDDLKLAAMNGPQLSALEEMGAQVQADESFRQLLSRIREAGQKSFPLPANIHAELRSYQITGYQWMSRLAHWGAGACLSDDMGLGKTLQAITLLQSRAAQGPQLVIMPTSLLHNWEAELRRFAPALNVLKLNPQGTDRHLMVSEAGPADIVLATYGLLVTEGELLSNPTWTTIVLDEAHSIKNRDTQTSKAAMMLKADFRLLLTGTPLQNHLNEIWNLFQFANPGLLGTYRQFTERFILPIERDHDAERQRLLRRLLSPFLLRRTKDEVLDELPEKTEITLRVDLSPEEQALYDQLREQAIARLEEGSKGILQTLAEITRLRQAACHPRLVHPELPIKSSKTQAFLDLVEELRQSGHRALVFSQFTSHLALIRQELDSRDIPYLYLDGSTSSLERDRLVRHFQTGSEPLFLISLKAGGLGLNLTAADYVIHLDPWWNPAIEDQASDRAHRIGQERPVTVYRIIAAGTIEEKILRLHQNKRSMADALLEDANLFTQISPDDVIRLLREGVEAIG